ncbi:ABC transporter ATP-binding protein [Salipiger sp.]|uniref:ABC transporter ATP-binding protein n=1 Tax=Salipiger sp. TaxID=2078585 RepID=UPI003A976572
MTTTELERNVAAGTAPLLEVRDLHTYFYTRRGVVKAVNGVSFSVGRGRTLGLVGESGSGKSATSMSLIRLVPDPPGRIVAGKILLEGEDLLTLSDDEMRRVRGGRISMMLQDPMSSLNPVFTIGDQIMEAIRIHQGGSRESLWDRAVAALKAVRISEPELRMASWPHQLSGGMRQRVVAAIAISCQPSLLIADEPTTALDVTIQAQLLNLLRDIQAERGMSIIFVTHDFGVVADMCDEVAVMYAGQIVETASTLEIFDNPQHPYTQALLASLPDLDDVPERLPAIPGQPPALHDLPVGCAFAERCSKCMAQCRIEAPPAVEVSKGHMARCWRAG